MSNSKKARRADNQQERQIIYSLMVFLLTRFGIFLLILFILFLILILWKLATWLIEPYIVNFSAEIKTLIYGTIGVLVSIPFKGQMEKVVSRFLSPPKN